MKTLLFFTSQFPFGAGEAFVENEFPFLLKSFERIFIITNNIADKQTRTTPDNVHVIRIPYEPSFGYKVMGLFNYFSPTIQQELKFIDHHLHVPVDAKIRAAFLSSYAKAIEVSGYIQSLIAEHKIDTRSLYLYSYWMNNMAIGAALFKSKHPEVKAICRAHGWDVYFERHQPAYLPLRNFILENLNACYCISENGKEYLDNLTEKKLSAHLNLSRLGTLNASGKRNEGNVGKLVLLSCSNIIPLKRVHLIIEALAYIKDIPVEWIHFGEGNFRSEMEILAERKLSDSPNIWYNFSGYISNPKLLQFYASNKIDLFVNVSETEGLPVSIMEANSFGIPAVATDVGGVREILRDGVNGILLEKCVSPEKIAEIISQFYSMAPLEKNKMKEKALELWDENFNAEKNYKTFVSSLSEL